MPVFRRGSEKKKKGRIERGGRGKLFTSFLGGKGKEGSLRREGHRAAASPYHKRMAARKGKERKGGEGRPLKEKRDSKKEKMLGLKLS